MKIYLDSTRIESKKYTTVVSIYLNGTKVKDGVMKRAELCLIEFPYNGEDIELRLDVINKKDINAYEMLSTLTFQELAALDDKYISVANQLKRQLMLTNKEFYRDEKKKNKNNPDILTSLPSVKDIFGMEDPLYVKSFEYMYNLKISNVDPNKDSIVITYSSRDEYVKFVHFAVPINIDDEDISYIRKKDSKEIKEEFYFGKKRRTKKKLIILLLTFLLSTVPFILNFNLILSFKLLLVVFIIPNIICILPIYDYDKQINVFLASETAEFRYKDKRRICDENLKIYIDATMVEASDTLALASIYLNGTKVKEGIMQRAELNVLEFKYNGEEIELRFDSIERKGNLHYSFLPSEKYEYISTLGKEYSEVVGDLKREFHKTSENNIKISHTDELGLDEIEVSTVKTRFGYDATHEVKELNYLYNVKINKINPDRKIMVIDIVEEEQCGRNPVPFLVDILPGEEVIIERKYDKDELRDLIKKNNQYSFKESIKTAIVLFLLWGVMKILVGFLSITKLIGILFIIVYVIYICATIYKSYPTKSSLRYKTIENRYQNG